MAAAFLKVPELELDEKEAERLGKAVAQVQNLYDLPIFTEKQMAWFNLTTTGAAIYGPRFMAAKIRKAKEKSGPREAAPSRPLVVMEMAPSHGAPN